MLRPYSHETVEPTSRGYFSYIGQRARRMSTRNGVGVDFEERKIRIGGREHEVLYVLYVLFAAN